MFDPSLSIGILIGSAISNIVSIIYANWKYKKRKITNEAILRRMDADFDKILSVAMKDEKFMNFLKSIIEKKDNTRNALNRKNDSPPCEVSKPSG